MKCSAREGGRGLQAAVAAGIVVGRLGRCGDLEGAGDELLDADDVAVGVEEEDHRLALLEAEELRRHLARLGGVQADRRLVVEGHDQPALREGVPDEVRRLLHGLAHRLVAEQAGVSRQTLEHGADGDALRLPVGVEVRVAVADRVGRLLDARIEVQPGVLHDLLGAEREERREERPGVLRAGEDRVAEALGQYESELGVLHPDARAQLDAFAGERARLVRSVLDRVGVATADDAPDGSFGNRNAHLPSPFCPSRALGFATGK